METTANEQELLMEKYHKLDKKCGMLLGVIVGFYLGLVVCTIGRW